MELEDRAVYFATDADNNKLEDFWVALQETLAKHSSILDGKNELAEGSGGVCETIP